MKIHDFEDNCGLVALYQVAPDRSHADIIKACKRAGFEEYGMLPQQIMTAAELLGLKYTVIDLPTPKPTLAQFLNMTKNDVCLVWVSGHILSSNRGIPLDPNVSRRGARRRVLRACVIHNATIARRVPGIEFDDPLLMFDCDLRHETHKSSARMKLYVKMTTLLGDDWSNEVQFSELRKLGYTRKMMMRHYNRGELHIVKS